MSLKLYGYYYDDLYRYLKVIILRNSREEESSNKDHNLKFQDKGPRESSSLTLQIKSYRYVKSNRDKNTVVGR